ncbi:MAG: flagellar hook-basal body complex protein FliE [Synergistaceae bacterium]|nr:flagellar hook-basal body complex protein FliE [Synergistaceae bacterium]
MGDFRIDLSKYALKSNQSDKTRKTIDYNSIDGMKSFESLLSESIKGVNDLQKESDKLIQRLATGDVDDISEVVLASSRAEVAMRMLMEVRNKLVEAYQQISRMQG